MKLPEFVYRIILLCSVALFLIAPQPVFATISACAATVDMDSVLAETTNTITFSVTNNTDNAEAGAWIKLTTPSGNFTLAGSPSSPGWSNTNDSSTMTMTGGSVDAGGSYTFSIQVTSSNVTASSANWGIQLSSDAGGADPTSCTGSLGTAITGGGGDSTAPTISSLTVTDIGASSARITWTTNEAATSVVQYGTTGDYGATKTDTSLTTSHSVTIDSLSALTTYHYSVQGADAAGNTGDSGENTFVTNAASSTTTTSTTGTVRTITATPSPTPIPDKVGPSISVSTKFEKTYTEPPQIEGTARDPSGVASIEYSLDDGINFIPLDDIKIYGKTSVPFLFEPYQSDDGNYSLVFRSTDGKGNVKTVKSEKFVIDRLPPIFGASVLTFGSQVIEPIDQVAPVIAGMDYVLTSSLIGGAITMKYSVENSRGEVADINAQKNADSGLWRAVLHFDEPGLYTVFGTAVDGAANKSVKELLRVTVRASGIVMEANGHPISSATVTVFVLDSALQKYVKWDGQSYGQKNPIHTDATGAYGFALPVGSYYLEVRAFGYKTSVSDIFTTNQITPIVQNITLLRSFGLKIGQWLIPLFDFSQTRMIVATGVSGNQNNQVSKKIMTGKELPFFRFPLRGSYITSLDLRGKITLITILNTWSPLTAPQLSVLDSIAGNPAINMLSIVPEESTASVDTFMKRGAYRINMVADPDGTLIDLLSYSTSPTHIVVDRKGIITAVITGLATKEKILDTIVE